MTSCFYVCMSDFDNVLEDISSFSSCFNSVVWSHVKMGGNYVASHLSKIVPFGMK